MTEVQPPTVDEVCVIRGAGRGECWGCPVTSCVLWQNPFNPLSAETLTVALSAAQQLASRVVVIQPDTAFAQRDHIAEAGHLALSMSDPEVQVRARVDMACEAIIQDLLHSDIVKRRNQYTDRWAKSLRGAAPTEKDDHRLDALMDQADADVAAESYGVKAEDVLVRMRWFRNRRIVRLDRDI